MIAVRIVPARIPATGLENFKEKTCKFRYIRQRLYCAAHGFHTKHQHCESQKDGSDIFLTGVLGKSQKNDSDQCQDRRKRTRFQKADKKVAALNSSKAQKPGSDGSSDIRTHDDADCLCQFHDS